MQTPEHNNSGWADSPVVQQRIRYLLYVVCGLLVVTDLLVHRHTYLPVEEIPAFYAFYGFAALVGVVMLAKMLRTLVGRDEDYYQQDGQQHSDPQDSDKPDVGQGDDHHAA